MKDYSESVVTGGITVIKVKEHKTGKFDTAKLTLDAKLANCLHRYVHTLRPLEVGDGVDPGTLFVLPGSKAITKWSNLEAFLNEARNRHSNEHLGSKNRQNMCSTHLRCNCNIYYCNADVASGRSS